jgi:hypothetical protein
MGLDKPSGGRRRDRDRPERHRTGCAGNEASIASSSACGGERDGRHGDRHWRDQRCAVTRGQQRLAATATAFDGVRDCGSARGDGNESGGPRDHRRQPHVSGELTPSAFGSATLRCHPKTLGPVGACRATARFGAIVSTQQSAAGSGGASSTDFGPGPSAATSTTGAHGAASSAASLSAQDHEGILTMKILGLCLLAGIAGSFVGNGTGTMLIARARDASGPHGAWYASRAAGIASYLFLWLGLVGGLLMSSAWFDGMVSRARLLAFHQTATIAGVLLGFAHGLVLTQDHWTHFGLFDVLVPFGSYYKTLLTGIGTLALYLTAVVSVSFWFRKQMGMKAWRYLHYSSALAFAGAFWHGLSIGTDAHSTWLMATYLGTTLSVVFGVMLRITYRRPAVKRSNLPVRTEAQAA